MKTGMNVHSFTELLISIMMQSFKGVTKTPPEKTPTLKFYLIQETHQFPSVKFLTDRAMKLKEC